MDTPLLYAKLTKICEAISRGEYEQAKAVFDLPPCDDQGHPVTVLAEALGMRNETAQTISFKTRSSNVLQHFF